MFVYNVQGSVSIFQFDYNSNCITSVAKDRGSNEIPNSYNQLFELAEKSLLGWVR